MALKIYDTLVPQGDYPAVKAEDVLMPDGKKLSELEIPESSGGVSSWNDLTDKPFYEEEGTAVILEEQDMDSFAMDVDFGVPSKGFTFGADMEAFTLVLGETYKVAWDGTVYEVPAQDASALFMEGALVLGEVSAFGLSGNGEPFVIGWTAMGISILSLTDMESIAHRVGITQNAVTVKTLDAKFLPMEAIDKRIDAYISAALEGEF